MSTVTCPTADDVLATPKQDRWATWMTLRVRRVATCAVRFDRRAVLRQGHERHRRRADQLQADAMPTSTVAPRGRLHTENEL